MRSRAASLAFSALFLVVAPGTVAGYLPWLISRWRPGAELGGSSLVHTLGFLLLLLGGAALLDSFFRFAWTGFGTPAPVAPTRRLIVTGLYRHVRNPMYVAVIALVIGQALLLERTDLLLYAGALWLCFHMFIVGYEEPKLRHQFPDDYSCYACAVRRWLPRLRPWRG